MTGPYDDIIHLPHHVSSSRIRMAAINRAAQFAPFAALTGYDAAIKETARLTDQKIKLDECAKAALNEKLQLMKAHAETEVVITYFLPDAKKSGGKYIDAVGTVKRIDLYQRLIIMRDGRTIPIDDILEIENL